jgi:hypothetical protein
MNRITFLFLILVTFSANAQNDTIRIQKNQKRIYKCQTLPALSWYLQVNIKECILVDLKINSKDVKNWFTQFSNSQNIYTAQIQGSETGSLFFAKKNDPLDTLFFKIINFTDSHITLEIHPTGEIFEFSHFYN